MTSVQKIEGRKLIILRLAGIAMLIFLANQAYIGYMTGLVKIGTKRISLIMTGENLWLGFLFLTSSALICMFLLFINYNQTKKFKTLAKIFGGAWFLILAACILSDASIGMPNNIYGLSPQVVSKALLLHLSSARLHSYIRPVVGFSALANL